MEAFQIVSDLASGTCRGPSGSASHFPGSCMLSLLCRVSMMCRSCIEDVRMTFSETVYLFGGLFVHHAALSCTTGAQSPKYVFLLEMWCISFHSVLNASTVQ
jgi:hypothetical protein